MRGWSDTRGCATNPNWPSGAMTSDTLDTKSSSKPFSFTSVRTSCSTPCRPCSGWSNHKRDRAARLFSNFVTRWRYHWRSHEASTHILEEELESLQAYLTLEVQRLGRAVAMEVRIDPSVSRDGRLPALLLQPALENALWHGLDDSVTHPRLELVLTPQEGRPSWVNMVLRDNGVGLSRSSSTTSTDAPSDHVSMGTEITSMRLREVHPEARFELREARAPWSTEVWISLPLVVPNS